MMNRVLLSLFGFLMAPAAFAANNDVDLGNSGGGPLEAFSAFMQELVNFVGGPGVLFIAFVSAAAAIGLWVAAPKQGSAAMAWAFRVCVGVIFLMNIAILLTWLQGF